MSTSVRYDFYQSPSSVIVSIYKKGLRADEVKVDSTERSITILVRDDELIKLDPLSESIKPLGIGYKIFGTKIELVLPKSVGGRTWSTLVAAPGSAQSTSPLPPVTGTSTSTSTGATALQTPSSNPTSEKVTPSSEPISASANADLGTSTSIGETGSKESQGGTTSAQKTRKNWDKLVEDEEVEDAEAGPDDFFKKIFLDADPDTRRAMMKSMSESNGTVLSTNWDEIGGKKTEVAAPEGMETRKFT